jgi:ATP-dependent Zn protease
LKELGFLDKDAKVEVKIKDNSSDKFWSDIFPTILAFVLFFVVAMFLIGRMG